MSTFNTRAIIIKTFDYKENDKLVWLYSEKLGKISSVAHGAKKSRNKLGSLTLQFCFGEYLLYKGKNMFTISEGEIIESFQGFLDDFDTLMYASYICELIDIAVPEQESNRDMFREFATTFYLIKNKVGDIRTLTRAFEIKLLERSGYSLYFEGGNVNGILASSAACNTIRYLSKIPLEKVYRISISEEINDEIEKINGDIFYTSFMRRPKSLEMLNLMKRGVKNE